MDGREANNVYVDRTYDEIFGQTGGWNEDGIPVEFWKAACLHGAQVVDLVREELLL